MNKNDYINRVDSLKASEELKTRIALEAVQRSKRKTKALTTLILQILWTQKRYLTEKTASKSRAERTTNKSY